MDVKDDRVDRLEALVREEIGADAAKWPGGWPGDIDAAVIDAVYSIRAKYGNREKGTGVYGAVQRWRAQRPGGGDDLKVLADFDVANLREITNSAKASQRYKAEIVIDVATAFLDRGIRTSADFAESQDAARQAYLSVKGCGRVTWGYLRMLLGDDDVKPDTWIIRFVGRAVPEVASDVEAKRLVVAVSERLGVSRKDLDHAIWRHASGR